MKDDLDWVLASRGNAMIWYAHFYASRGRKKVREAYNGN
jgi:hypothetical protein